MRSGWHITPEGRELLKAVAACAVVNALCVLALLLLL